MTKSQIDLAGIKYVSKNVVALIDAARDGITPDVLSEEPPRGIRFIKAWYCPEGHRGAAERQEGVKLTASGKVQKAYWPMQAPKSREGVEFLFGQYRLRVIRGRAIDNRMVPVRVEEPGKPPRLVVYVGMIPGESTSSRARTLAELKSLEWTRHTAATCYIPRRGAEEGWARDDLSAQVAWWASRAGIASEDTEVFITAYANRIWPIHGASALFDGSFKAPLSPLAPRAHISYYRQLPAEQHEPGDEITYPARPRDMVRLLEDLGIGIRMIYRDAEAGNISCEISEGKRGREYFFLEKHEPQVVAYYQERRQRKAIAAGWAKARGVTAAAAREWIRVHLQDGDTLDDLEKIVREELTSRGLIP